MGVPIQKDNEASLDPEATGEENGEKVSPPHLTLECGTASIQHLAGSGVELRPKMVLF